MHTSAIADAPGVANRLPQHKRRIAIIGKAPSSVFLAPYKDDSWEIWILNTLGFNNEVPRWDRQFELHDIQLTRAKEYGGYYDWLSQQTKPLVLRDDPPEGFKGGVRYPLEIIQEHFKNLAGVKYITNTVSLMLAMAIYESDLHQDVEEIGLWGVDMAQHALKSGHAGFVTSEYARQRPSCEYWIGIAEGRGLKVTIPWESDLLKTVCIYGYHTDHYWAKMKARRSELAQRIQQAQMAEQQKHDEAIFLSGALEAANYHDQLMHEEAIRENHHVKNPVRPEGERVSGNGARPK